MKIGLEDKKKLGFVVVGALGLAAAFYMYNQLAVPDAPAAATAPVTIGNSGAGTSGARAGVARTESGGAGTTHAATTAELDPTLKMGPMLMTESLVYSGSGRNIFSATSVPVTDIPKAIAPARPKTPVVTGPVVPAGPPPAPPIDLKFFGTATGKSGARQAFLLHGEDVFLASPGDIVQRRYRIVSVAANSVVVEDMANNNRQTLPLLTN